MSRRSGKPARTAQTVPLTVKQQRAAQRAAKLEKYQKLQARSRRNKRIGIIAGVLIATCVIALIAVSIALTPRFAQYDRGSEGARVAGVETFENASEHVETAVDYPQTPPVGGAHSATWLNCGVYSEPVPNENAVHSLEHGSVWISYDADELSEQEIGALRGLLPATHAILSPYEGLDAAVVLSAWNAQLKVDSVEDERLAEFFEEYWLGGSAPEPGASCSGGIGEAS